MKTVTVVMTRHAKNVKGMLESSEIGRAGDLGYEALSGYDFRVVVTSPLPLAIHTAFAIITGQLSQNEHPMFDLSAPRLLPVMPEFVSDAMFTEMTAPEGFRARAAQVGNFAALWELHSEEKVREWQKSMMESLEALMNTLDHGDVVLHVSHSPSIELCLQGFAERNNFLLPEDADNLKELESVAVEFTQEDDGKGFAIKHAEKIPAPAA